VRISLVRPRDVAPPSGADSIATVAISGLRTLVELWLDPEIAFGDGYADERITVNEDLVGLLEHAFQLMERRRPEPWHRKLLSHWLDRIQANTIAGSARNIHSHYDLTTQLPDIMPARSTKPIPAYIDHLTRNLLLKC
jgi:hypothetical protein